MTRPWRLTRRQRVEMEAALSGIRPGRPGYSATAEHVLHAADLLGYWHSTTLPRSREEWRILRARVAIALRAALRADEDARCEEVLAQAGGYEAEWDACVSLMREWPEVAHGPHPTATARGADVYGWPQTHPCADMRVPAHVVPLALWERTR